MGPTVRRQGRPRGRAAVAEPVDRDPRRTPAPGPSPRTPGRWGAVRPVPRTRRRPERPGRTGRWQPAGPREAGRESPRTPRPCPSPLGRGRPTSPRRPAEVRRGRPVPSRSAVCRADPVPEGWSTASSAVSARWRAARLVPLRRRRTARSPDPCARSSVESRSRTAPAAGPERDLARLPGPRAAPCTVRRPQRPAGVGPPRAHRRSRRRTRRASSVDARFRSAPTTACRRVRPGGLGRERAPRSGRRAPDPPAALPGTAATGHAPRADPRPYRHGSGRRRTTHVPPHPPRRVAVTHADAAMIRSVRGRSAPNRPRRAAASPWHTRRSAGDGPRHARPRRTTRHRPDRPVRSVRRTPLPRPETLTGFTLLAHPYSAAVGKIRSTRSPVEPGGAKDREGRATCPVRPASVPGRSTCDVHHPIIPRSNGARPSSRTQPASHRTAKPDSTSEPVGRTATTPGTSEYPARVVPLTGRQPVKARQR